jgi:CheY-like chemotaxis protein
MRIVLIEDDPQKAERISEALLEFSPGAQIETFRSYQSGLRALQGSQKPDLIVLDMSLPTYDPLPNSRHGRPRPLGGYDVMRKLKRLAIGAPVVVLTALENFGSPQQPITLADLTKNCARDFPNTFKGAIYYSQSLDTWKSELLMHIRRLS